MNRLWLLLVFVCSVCRAERLPNVIVILADDLGYGDLSCYGNARFATPNLDKLAKEGVRFTNFYSASTGCSPARAALLTGCYPQRVSIPQVLFPNSKTGLNPLESTIADLLRERGYATGMVGKWHIGATPALMPLSQGFEEYYGLPYSNDMWPPNSSQFPPLFLQEGNRQTEEVKTISAQGLLTRKYTERALTFIRKNHTKPFFLYFAHSMSHVPINASPPFLGKSGAGLYGDTVQEMDWSVGRIVRELNRLGLEKDTLIVFTSDNGPWIPYGDHAGSTGGLREGKGTTFEGGFREPSIWWWPGQVTSGVVCDDVATTMDILPTLVRLTGAKMPALPIDGKDISSMLRGEEGGEWAARLFFYYWPDELQAVRVGKWKLHVAHSHRHQSGEPGKFGKSAGETTAEIGISLFDLVADPGEMTDLSKEFPEEVKRLMKLIEVQRLVLGDKLTDTPGREVRAPGRVIE